MIRVSQPLSLIFSFTFRSLNLHENRSDFKIKTSRDGSIVKFIGTILNWLWAGGGILFFFFGIFYSFFLCLYCSISYPHRLLISSMFFVVPPSLVSIFSFLPHLMLFSSIHYLPDYVSTILCPSQDPSSSLLLLTPSFLLFCITSSPLWPSSNNRSFFKSESCWRKPKNL